MSSDESIKLKHFQDAIKGRRLSGCAAYEINTALCEEHPYVSYYEQGDTLSSINKPRLQAIVDRMIASGVKPAASLLTPHQQRAIARRNA